MKEHAKKCSTNSNVGLPKAQKDESHCDCDGYHTFDELYDHRITLFITLCKEYQRDRFARTVWRSKSHHPKNDPMYEGWFVLGIHEEAGKQITYHLPLSRWKETGFADELGHAPSWDGHTSDDVVQRLKSLYASHNAYDKERN